jgi:hypothetical protein
VTGRSKSPHDLASTVEPIVFVIDDDAFTARDSQIGGLCPLESVSGPVLDGETPGCAALSLLGKFRFPADV